jgi:hypothetical protein
MHCSSLNAATTSTLSSTRHSTRDRDAIAHWSYSCCNLHSERAATTAATAAAAAAAAACAHGLKLKLNNVIAATTAIITSNSVQHGFVVLSASQK